MKSIRPFPGKSRRGFTLLEMLVATTVSGIMMVMFTQMLGSTFNIWFRTRGAVDNFTRARAVLDMLQVDLSKAIIRPDLGVFCDASGNASDTYGNAYLSFYSERSGTGVSSTERQLGLISYGLTTDSNGNMILKRSILPVGWGDANLVSFGVGNKLPQLSNGSVDNQDTARGVVSLTIKFLDVNGNVKSTFNRNSAQAVAVALLVVDERVNARLSNDLRTALADKFQSAASEAESQQTSVDTIWRQILDDTSFWKSYPAGMAASVKVLERTYWLPVTAGS